MCDETILISSNKKRKRKDKERKKREEKEKTQREEKREKREEKREKREREITEVIILSIIIAFCRSPRNIHPTTPSNSAEISLDSFVKEK